MATTSAKRTETILTDRRRVWISAVAVEVEATGVSVGTADTSLCIRRLRQA